MTIFIVAPMEGRPGSVYGPGEYIRKEFLDTNMIYLQPPGLHFGKENIAPPEVSPKLGWMIGDLEDRSFQSRPDDVWNRSDYLW